MLKASVGLTRKAGHGDRAADYQICLESEIPGSPDDPGATLDAVQHLFGIAEEVLTRQMHRGQDNVAAGHRPCGTSDRKGETGDRQEEPATRSQVEFLYRLARRHGLSRAALEKRMARVLGRKVRDSQLRKRELEEVIDALNEASLRKRWD